VPVRLWVDTDVGTNPDDAIALLVAAAHPGVEVVGVSTVGVDAGRRAVLAAELLEAAGIKRLPPVVAGLPEAGAGDALLPAVRSVAPDALLAIGPLTNVAALTATGVRPPVVTVMGGALKPVHHRGALRKIESNFGEDPRAAAVTLSLPGVTLVPLDFTVATRLGEDDRWALVEAAPVLEPMVERWLRAQVRRGVPPAEVAVHLHDPAALLVAAGEPFARRELRRLRVEADGRVVEAPGGAFNDVVADLDGRAVVECVLELLGARARPAQPPAGG
jgi:inosine-uridine nucleoside N-ribohydrolase